MSPYGLYAKAHTDLGHREYVHFVADNPRYQVARLRMGHI
jgi:hypothetical protein